MDVAQTSARLPQRNCDGNSLFRFQMVRIKFATIRAGVACRTKRAVGGRGVKRSLLPGKRARAQRPSHESWISGSAFAGKPLFSEWRRSREPGRYKALDLTKLVALWSAR